MNELKYEGASIFVEKVEFGYEYEVFSNLDDAKLGGGWSEEIGKIKSQFNSPGDVLLWALSGNEIKLGV